jgi:SAM-dependent methyltransferase
VLGYRVPEDLHALLMKTGRHFTNILDLGCGTGLASPLLRQIGTRLTGIDLSPRMLEKAAERQLYDCLIESEVGAFLAQTNETFDLVIAADLLVYFGDLAPLLQGIAAVLEPGGLFALNVETTTRADFVGLPSGRFAHAAGYIEALSRADFVLVEKQETTIRLEANQPVAASLSSCNADSAAVSDIVPRQLPPSLHPFPAIHPEPFLRQEAGFVGHFARPLHPIAEIHMRQAKPAGAFDVIEDHECTERTFLLLRPIKGIDH